MVELVVLVVWALVLIGGGYLLGWVLDRRWP